MVHLLWCTLRPPLFASAHGKWMLNAADKNRITTHVCVDDDPARAAVIAHLRSVTDKWRVALFKPPYAGICLPLYALTSTLEYSDSDVIVVASDDFLCPPSWDEYVVRKLSEKPGVLFARDGVHDPERTGPGSNIIVSIPIMSGCALRRMNNIVYHPAYHHFYSDNELFANARDLGILVDDRKTDMTTFQHQHWTVSRRSFDHVDGTITPQSPIDGGVYRRRMAMPVEERIKYV